MNNTQIIKVDNETNEAYAVVTDIAEYCEVETKSVQRLILKNIELFEEASCKLADRIREISNRSVPIKFELIKSGKGNEVDWSSTKMYQPHIELLLMLMKNTESVKQHKMELVVEFFANKVELLHLKAEQQQRLIEAEKEKVEQLEDKVHTLEVNKYKKWKEGYESVSRFLKKNNIKMTPKELNDRLVSAGELIDVTRPVAIRELSNESIGEITDKGSLIFPEWLLEQLV